MSDDNPNPYQAPSVIEGPSIVGPSIEGPGGEANPLFDGRLAKTGLGLKLIHYGIVTLLLSWIGLLPLGLLMTTFTSQPLVETMVQWIYGGTTLAAFGLLNLGPFFCLTVPSGYGLRPLAVATAIAIVLFWAAVIMMMMFATSFQGVSYVPLLLVFGTLLAFLYRLSRVLGRDDLTRRCRTVIVVGSVVLAFGLSASLIPNNAAFFSGVWLVWPLVISFGGLLFFVAFSNLINALANAIRRPGVRKPSLF